jgi:hypothetical protein
MLSAPVGQGAFSSSGYDPLVKLALSKELPRGFGVGANINLAAPSDSTGHWFQSAASVSVDHDLPLGLSGFWELYRVTPAERDGRADLVADTGVMRALGRNAQVDLEAGRRLSPWRSSWFIGAGFAVRIGHSR